MRSEGSQIDRDSEFLDGNVRKALFPAKIEMGQLIEVVKALEKLDSGVKFLELGKILREDHEKLGRLIIATQILAFTKIHDGRIWLSKRGERLNHSHYGQKIDLIKERMRIVEPFRTAVEVAKNENIFSSHRVASLLEDHDLSWAEDEELNELIIHDILLDWSIFTGLLSYDGKKDRFSRPT
jgi:hypothetical protein